MTSDITSVSVIAIQGNPITAQVLDGYEDGYVLTWSGSDGYWKAAPSSKRVLFSSLKTSNYTISINDYIIGIGTLSSSIIITLPASPTQGDIYIVKDVNGSCGNPYAVLIDGNGSNIDGFGTTGYMLNIIYQSTTFVFNGYFWSII